MATLARLCFLIGLLASGIFISAPALAECGGQQQCIAVSIDPAVAPAHGTPLTSGPLDFGDQLVGTTSAARTIYVGAVTGSGYATLDAIALGDTNASVVSEK